MARFTIRLADAPSDVLAYLVDHDDLSRGLTRRQLTEALSLEQPDQPITEAQVGSALRLLHDLRFARTVPHGDAPELRWTATTEGREVIAAARAGEVGDHVG